MKSKNIFPRRSSSKESPGNSRLPSTALLFAALAVGVATARGQSMADHIASRILPGNSARVDHTRMYYDEPGDGSLWARGASYKASFDAAGATYYPAFGKRAAHDMPHALSPDSVTVGGTALAFERGARATRVDDHVAIDRAAFIERYDLAPESVEQSIVFTSLPSRGDLVLHIPVASEMNAVETENGLEFRGDLGRVTYGRATAVDARGQRAQALTHVENGAITIRVDAKFLAGASLPLVIDPLVATVFVTSIAGDDFQADSAWDPSNQVWLVVYEETFSATDTDVYAKVYDNSGTLLLQNSVDITGDSWVAPRCANCATAHNFLVVAENVHLTTHTIRGRLVMPNGTLLTVGAQFTISDGTSGNKTAPSVGGDPSTVILSNFCVAYVQEIPSTTNSSIAVCTVTSGGVPAAPIFLSNAGSLADTNPSVSKSNDTNNWLIAFRRNGGMTLGDIWAAHVHRDGALVDGPFGITSAGLDNDGLPCASSPLHGTSRTAIAFERNHIPSSNHEIMVAALDGTTVLQIADLNGIESNGNPGQDQVEPAIDSDGRHFLAAYSEQDAVTGAYTVFAADLYLAGSTLGVAESHILLHQFGLDSRNTHISAAHDVNATSHRFFPVYEVTENPTDHDVAGALFDVVEGGAMSVFCAGTAALCPCANAGSGSNGCANSVNANGASLGFSGLASTLSDSVSLLASGMPTSVSCLWFQGTTMGSAVFGDGLRCATGTIKRLATKTTNSFGSSTFPASGDPHVSVKGMVTADGGSRTYQVWYRNSASFCTSSTFNLTNGVLIDWAR